MSYHFTLPLCYKTNVDIIRYCNILIGVGKMPILSYVGKLGTSYLLDRKGLTVMYKVIG
jgi:hypothetical protein